MTRIHVHELAGLNPDSLATYLAALGMFRLLAEQKDACVRGFWRDEHFVLVTELDWDAVEQFFLQDYRPTPILAPWNMESGFYSLKPPKAAGDEALDSADASKTSGAGEGEESGDADLADAEDGDGKEGDTEEAVGDSLLDRIGASGAPRFASFRRAIEVALENIPAELRDAERNSQRAHAEMKANLADASLTQAEQDVEKLKAEIDALKASAKGTKKGSPAQEALVEGQARLKQAKQYLKDQKTNLQKTLKDRSKDLKAPIEEAKKRFKDLQSLTKARLIADLRARWGDEGQQWVDSALGLEDDLELRVTSLFGSGGNDGRMEFTRNLRRHLNALFDIDTGQARDKAADQLRAAVSGLPTNFLLGTIDGKKVKVGQLFPGRAGGTNMGAGFAGGATVNPWEFVLMLEGAVALVAGMTRRGSVGRARVSSPFWVEAVSAGYGSASDADNSLSGEQWFPLWSRPLEYGELVELIREGRAQVGRRKTKNAGDLARATARLGLARGIDSLQRFAYLKRNGKSNFAVSAGRFQVTERSHQMLLEDVAPWIDSLTRYANENNVPVSLGAIARRTQEALFAVCRHDATPTEWRELLITLGSAEFALLRSGKNPSRRPLPKLSCGWIAAVDDGSDGGRAALRLALALASQHRPPEKNDGTLKGSVRQHFVPLVDPDGDRPRFRLDDHGRAEPDPEDVCMGRDLVTDAIALVRRRSIWARTSGAAREKTPQLPLWPVASCEATLEEIGSWVRGECSDKDVLALVRPLLALNWSETADRGSGLPPWRAGEPDPLQVLFRLAHLPFDVPVQDADGKQEIAVSVRLDPEPLRRLAAGDLDGALRVAVRRLDASGLRPVFRRGVVTPALARRLAASLAFPISRTDAARAAQLVCKPYDTKEQLSSLG
jgi:CRISPR-associated protein Csx17